MHIHRTIFSTGSLLGLLVIFVYLYAVSTVFAADSSPTYVPLIGIPGVSTNSSLPDYINDIYKITIGVGAMFAVVRIALAGVKYSMSGVVTDKAEAKKDIKGVLLGLAILLLPALVLGTINPQILNLDVLKNVNSKINMVPFTGTGSAKIVGVGGSTLGTISTNPTDTINKAEIGCNGKAYCSTLAICYGAGGTVWISNDTSDASGTSGGKCYK